MIVIGLNRTIDMTIASIHAVRSIGSLVGHAEVPRVRLDSTSV